LRLCPLRGGVCFLSLFIFSFEISQIFPPEQFNAKFETFDFPVTVEKRRRRGWDGNKINL